MLSGCFCVICLAEKSDAVVYGCFMVWSILDLPYTQMDSVKLLLSFCPGNPTGLNPYTCHCMKSHQLHFTKKLDFSENVTELIIQFHTINGSNNKNCYIIFLVILTVEASWNYKEEF